MAGATPIASCRSRWPRPSRRCCSGSRCKDGKIRSLDDRAQDYVPALKGSAYGETSLRALLTMSSGVAWSETYGPDDDISHVSAARLFRAGMPGAAALLRALHQRARCRKARAFTTPAAKPKCSASCSPRRPAERLTDYASERLWKPMGAEADATVVGGPRRATSSATAASARACATMRASACCSPMTAAASFPRRG